LQTGKKEIEFELVRSSQNGDEKSFEQLVKRYEHRIAGFVNGVLGRNTDVEDITQEIFVRVFKSLNGFKFDSPFSTWLHRIAINICIDEIRKRKVRKLISFDFLFTEHELEPPSTSVKEGIDFVLDKEEKRVIIKAIAKLDPIYRIVILLREYEDLSYNEIAEMLRIKPQAVKTRLYRARQQLMDLLKHYFPERL
jgi:RNA polymerase sigma-70 factor (ECF subfamily)